MQHWVPGSARTSTNGSRPLIQRTHTVSVCDHCLSSAAAGSLTAWTNAPREPSVACRWRSVDSFRPPSTGQCGSCSRVERRCCVLTKPSFAQFDLPGRPLSHGRVRDFAARREGCALRVPSSSAMSFSKTVSPSCNTHRSKCARCLIPWSVRRLCTAPSDVGADLRGPFSWQIESRVSPSTPRSQSTRLPFFSKSMLLDILL